MNVKQAYSMINSLRDGWYNGPSSYYLFKKVEFERQSYARSAIEEIKMALLSRRTDDPVSVVEDFRYQMDCFACEAQNGSANFMFSVYYDVATDVLDVLLGM